MSIVLVLIEIIGSVGLFLYGMKIMSEGLQKTAGSKLRAILSAMTKNRFMAVITGAFLTMVIQSSSAVTVMVVSFVSASLLTLSQGIGVIFGANIGTTVTSWVISLLGFEMDISILALASIAISLPLIFSKRPKRRELAEIFLGFGFLFLGLNFLKSSMPDISSSHALISFIERFNNDNLGSILLCVLVGAIFTMLVQSSSASMAFTITLAYQGWIGVWSAAALCLGQNIGTTITGIVASFSTGTNGKRTALAHTLFNVIGSILAIIFFKPLMELVNVMTPGDVLHSQIEAAADLPLFLSMFHTVFNVIVTLVFIPFLKPFTRLIEYLIPQKESSDSDVYHFKYIGTPVLETPELYLIAIKDEVRKMGAMTEAMFSDYQELCFKQGDVSEDIAKLKRTEDYADQMQEQLIDFCVAMLQDSQTPTDAATLQRLIRVIDETESITDSIYNMAKLNETKRNNDLHFTDEEKDGLRSYNNLILSFMSSLTVSLGSRISLEALKEAEENERRVNDMHDELADQTHNTLSQNPSKVKTMMLYLEVIRNLEHIGDYLINIAEAEANIKKHTNPPNGSSQ